MIEHELIERARRGEGRAIRALYDRHAPRVLAIVRRLAGDDVLAEDFAQDAWVQAIRALPRFRGEARFSTWLYRIAVNAALHGRRSQDRRARREAEAVIEAPHANGGHEPLLRMKLERALERLPERMRHVLVLHDVEGYTHAEIAELMGVTEGTSKSQLFKARARMRGLLRGSAEPVEGGEVCHT